MLNVTHVNRTALPTMELYAPYEVKLTKRIKLEHSYARGVNQFEFAEVREEDPLKIYPEDLDGIKKESEEVETIVIKTEPDCDDGQGKVGAENQQEEPLLQLIGSEPCESAESNFFSNSLEPVNCEVIVGSNSSSNDTVPKHVFLELQRMYEKAMTDVKALNKKVDRDTRQKKASQAARNHSANIKNLKSDIKKLKDQLNTAKTKEQLLKKTLDARLQEENEIKQLNATLKSQLDDMIKVSKERNSNISEVKSQLQAKEDLVKTLKITLKQQARVCNQRRKECLLLTQKLASANAKLALHEKELGKLKLDMDIMDKSIIDSLRTRQALNDQVTQIEKELQELKDKPSVAHQLQETQKGLNEANRRVTELQLMLGVEKKMVMSLMKEKEEAREARVQTLMLQQTVAALKKTLGQKMEQCRLATEESRKMREKVDLKTEELQKMEAVIKMKDEELKVSKQCEYCGF